MNEATLPGLIVPIEARIDKLEKGLERANRAQRRAAGQMERRANKSAQRIEKTYNKMGNSMSATFKRMSLPLLAGIGSAATVRALRDTTRGIAQIGDEAKRAGVSAKAFQEWKFVAEQNRIGIDAMTDGLKELNLRADEFVITGKGPAAAAFERLGYSAADLKKKLKDPSKLLLEIFERSRKLKTAARIRIADEIFGGTAGERFVELMARSDDELRGTIDRAHELGLVLSNDTIAKAAELDRKFGEIQARISTMAKRGVVALADGLDTVISKLNEIHLLRVSDRVDDLLGTPGGAEAYSKLGDESAEANRNLEDLMRTQTLLPGLAYDASNALFALSNELDAVEQGDAAGKVDELVDRLADLAEGASNGSIKAEDLRKRLAEATGDATALFEELQSVNGVDLSGAMSAVAALSKVIGGAIERANALRTAMPGAVPDDSGELTYGPSSRGGKRRKSELAPTSSVRPQLPSVNASFGVPDAPRGGGGAARDPYGDDVRAMETEIATMIKEAEALNDLSLAFDKYGIAQDVARRKAELLQSAQEAGKIVTPELRAEIDRVAESYANAAQRAEEARQRHEEFQNAVSDMKGSLKDAFTGLLTGAHSFKDALSGVLMKLAEIAASRAFENIFSGLGGGGLLGGLLKIIGFADGGYTGDGGKFEPAGVVHKGEYVLSKEATKNIGVGNLEALHNAAKRGYASGGYVGGAAPLRGASAARSESLGDSGQVITINAPVTVNASGGSANQNADLAKRVSREMELTMRGVVVDELRRQHRPGNIMNKRQR